VCVCGFAVVCVVAACSVRDVGGVCGVYVYGGVAVVVGDTVRMYCVMVVGVVVVVGVVCVVDVADVFFLYDVDGGDAGIIGECIDCGVGVVVGVGGTGFGLRYVVCVVTGYVLDVVVCVVCCVIVVMLLGSCVVVLLSLVVAHR